MTAAEECDLGCGSGVQISCFLSFADLDQMGSNGIGTDWRVYREVLTGGRRER